MLVTAAVAAASLATADAAAYASAAATTDAASVATFPAAAPVTAALVAVAPFDSPAFGQIIFDICCMHYGVLGGGSGLQ